MLHGKAFFLDLEECNEERKQIITLQLQALGARVYHHFEMEQVTDVITDKVLSPEMKKQIMQEVKMWKSQQSSVPCYPQRSMFSLASPHFNGVSSDNTQWMCADDSSTPILPDTSNFLNDIYGWVRLAHRYGKQVYHISKFAPWLDQFCPLPKSCPSPLDSPPTYSLPPFTPPGLGSPTTSSSGGRETTAPMMCTITSPTHASPPNNNNHINNSISYSSSPTHPFIAPSIPLSTATPVSSTTTTFLGSPLGGRKRKATDEGSNHRRSLPRIPTDKSFICVIDKQGLVKPLYKEFGMDGGAGSTSAPRIHFDMSGRGGSPFLSEESQKKRILERTARRKNRKKEEEQVQPQRRKLEMVRMPSQPTANPPASGIILSQPISIANPITMQHLQQQSTLMPESCWKNGMPIPQVIQHPAYGMRRIPLSDSASPPQTVNPFGFMA